MMGRWLLVGLCTWGVLSIVSPSISRAARTWESYAGPEGGPIGAFVTTSTGTLFAGANSHGAAFGAGIFRSNDHGGTWARPSLNFGTFNKE